MNKNRDKEKKIDRHCKRKVRERKYMEKRERER